MEQQSTLKEFLDNVSISVKDEFAGSALHSGLGADAVKCDATGLTHSDAFTPENPHMALIDSTDYDEQVAHISATMAPLIVPLTNLCHHSWMWRNKGSLKVLYSIV